MTGPQPLSLRDWLDALVAATEEVAVCALGLDGVKVLELRDQPPVGLAGSYLAVLSDQASVHVALVARIEDCQTLGKTLLALGPEDPPLAPADLADAFGEIVNILAGSLKSKLADRDATMRLGLPIFINGHITPSPGLSTATARLKLGSIEAEAMILRTSDRRARKAGEFLAVPG